MNWGNFSVDTGGNLNASNASFTGSINTGSTVTGSRITGGSIDINDGTGHYFNMGLFTDHPNCSGLNVAANGGINIGNVSMSYGKNPMTKGNAFLFNDNIYTAGSIIIKAASNGIAVYNAEKGGTSYGQDIDVKIPAMPGLSGGISLIFKQGILVGTRALS